MTYRAEFDTPDLALSTGYAQWEFFRAVNRLVPSVLEKLRGEPYRVFMQSRASLKGYDWQSLKELTQTPTPEEPDLVATREAVEAWAKSWNLNAPWVYKCACNTLEMWRSGTNVREFFPDAIRYGPATPLYSRSRFPEQLAVAFEGFMGYEPTYETASEFKKRFDDVCKSFLGTYMADQEREAASRDYPEYPDKRKLELHLEWAVLYQVREMSPEDIAREYVRPPPEEGKRGRRPDDREVRRICHSTLELINLESRKPKRGG